MEFQNPVIRDISDPPEAPPCTEATSKAGLKWLLSLKGLGGVRSAAVCPENGARGCKSSWSQGPTGAPAPASQLR